MVVGTAGLGSIMHRGEAARPSVTAVPGVQGVIHLIQDMLAMNDDHMVVKLLYLSILLHHEMYCSLAAAIPGASVFGKFFRSFRAFQFSSDSSVPFCFSQAIQAAMHTGSIHTTGIPRSTRPSARGPRSYAPSLHRVGPPRCKRGRVGGFGVRRPKAIPTRFARVWTPHNEGGWMCPRTSFVIYNIYIYNSV